MNEIHKESSELAQLQLLKSRCHYLRLDWTPFSLVYGILFADMLKNTLKHNAETLFWLRIQLGAIFIIHVLLALFSYWSVSVKALVKYYPIGTIQEADAAIVRLKGFTAKKVLVPLIHRPNVESKGKEERKDDIRFETAFQTFVYNHRPQTFQKLVYPIQERLIWYMNHEGYRSAEDIAKALTNWGPNLIEVSVPEFLTLLQQQLLAPFFVFQVFCVGLWCLDEYWMYSVFTLFMLVFFECTVSGQRLRNLHHLRSLQSPKHSTSVYRQSKWEKIPGELLLPGDIISVGRTQQEQDEWVTPADVVLLGGSCIVDESVLTGESTPQWKSPISVALEEGCTPDMSLDLKRDKSHILFGGTKCLQYTTSKTSTIKTPDGGCLAIVIRTGFETAQGKLMGTILHSTEHVTANNWETGIFILFLLCFALAASGYVLYHGLQDPSRSRFKLFLSCTMIITSVIPPELPMELSIAVNQSLIRLIKKKIFCTEPFRIPFAGKVDVCCFDKTGTLTDDKMVLEGVAGLKTTELDSIVAPTQLPIETTRVLATCHSLVVVDGELIGDPVEKAAFEALGWGYRSDLAVSPKRSEELMILHRHHFSAQLKRMSAIVRYRPANGASKDLVVSKGAPEIMFSRMQNPPNDYHRIHKRFAARGGRILALGFRWLDVSKPSEEAVMRGNDREAAEKNLQFAGFAVFQCPLKTESAPALQMLKDASHQLMMITGDSPLTACNAASRVFIVTRPVLILNLQQDGSVNPYVTQDADLIWQTPDETQSVPFHSDRQELIRLASEWDLCVTGEAFPYFEKRHLMSLVLPLIQVFARVAPEHKERVVNVLKAEGRVVLMCGDGTNDVGGLKAAHVGVALLTGLLEKAKKLAEKKRLEKSRGSKSSVQKPKPQNRATTSKNPALQMIEQLESQGRPVPPRLRKMAELVEELDQDVGLLKPGDASMAAPFTAKKASVMPCTDLIMQGRSTLVSTLQMFKILGLMSLANAYALSVMNLQGVKIGDVQITVTGLLTSGMFFFLSNTQPLSVLSKTRPHPNIFCAYVFLSILGQSFLNIAYLIYMYRLSVLETPDSEMCEIEDPEDEENSSFTPNLVNSVCFLVNFIIQIITFAVNYSGAPFTTPLLKNQGLSKCLLISTILVILLALDCIPGLNSMLEMVPIPMHLQAQILFLGLADFLLTYGLENVLRVRFPAKCPPEKGFMAHNMNKTAKKNL